MNSESKRTAKVILLLVVIGLFLFVPVVPVKVAPEVTIRVVDTEGKYIPNIAIRQSWEHYSYDSAKYEVEEISNDNGYITFSEKKIWTSLFYFLLCTVVNNTIGLFAIHSDSGPHTNFYAKDYYSEKRGCYSEPKCENREVAKEILIKERKK